jgi:heme-degrading monooxygenase HmoA
MISRIWHGYTGPGEADAYEALLRDEILTGIEDRGIAGLDEIQLFRRTLGDEVEFVTVMWFDSLDAVRAFAGDDHEASVVPPAARALLSRFDERSQHYEVRERRIAPTGRAGHP